MTTQKAIQNFINDCSIMHFGAVNIPTYSIGGAILGDSGLSTPLLNGVVKWNPETQDPQQTVDLVSENYKVKNIAHSWWVETSNASLHESLLTKGYSILGEISGLFMDPHEVIAPHATLDLSIELVQNETDLKEWSEVVCTAFEFSLDDTLTYSKVFQHTLNNENFFHVIGRKNGKAISTASLLLTSEGSYIYNLATLEKERNQGYASNILYSLLKKAEQLSLHKVGLMTSPFASSLCRKLGFKKICNYTIYI